MEEWVLDNTHSGFTGIGYDTSPPATHPFHAHVNHFHIVGYEGSPKVAELLDMGSWRDTYGMPTPGKLRIRYKAMDGIVGRAMLHCHIGVHSGRWMTTVIQIKDNCTNFKCTGKGCWSDSQVDVASGSGSGTSSVTSSVTSAAKTSGSCSKGKAAIMFVLSFLAALSM